MAFFKERMYCPVCNTYLGERYPNEIYISHCEECKTTFTWANKNKKPHSQLDIAKSKSCKCGSCQK